MQTHLTTDAFNNKIKTPCHDARYITSQHQDHKHPPMPTVVKVTCIPFNLQSYPGQTQKICCLTQQTYGTVSCQTNSRPCACSQLHNATSSKLM